MRGAARGCLTNANERGGQQDRSTRERQVGRFCGFGHRVFFCVGTTEELAQMFLIGRFALRTLSTVWMAARMARAVFIRMIVTSFPKTLQGTLSINPKGYTCKAVRPISAKFMAHTVEEKKRLLNRARRIRGQMDVILRTIEEESECAETLHAISVCRGALDSLMAEVIEGHIRLHVMDPKCDPTDEQTAAAEDLIDALKTYLK